MMPDIVFRTTLVLQCGQYNCEQIVEAPGTVFLIPEVEVDTVPLYSLSIACTAIPEEGWPEGWARDANDEGWFCPEHTGDVA